MPSFHFYHYQSDESVFQLRVFSLVYFIIFVSFFSRNTHLPYANNIDPDQMRRFSASDLGLHCSPLPLDIIG